MKTMDQKQWRREMADKFIAWRESRGRGGVISPFEVADWTQEVITETKEIYGVKDA